MSDRSFPSRRDFLALAAGTFVVAAVPVAWKRRSKLVRHSLPGVMGTTAELAVLHDDERYAHRAMQAALGELKRVEAMLTRYDANSEIGRVNRHGVYGPVAVSAETAGVLRAALDWAETTDGGFDPAIARMIDLWDVKHRHEPPAQQQVQRLAGRRLYRHIDLAGGTTPTVRLTEPDVQIDLGGIACGYGVDRAVAVLREWGIANGFINVGGDIYAMGHSEDGDAWKVGVRSPADPDAIVDTMEVEDAAVATSGDYEQFFLYRGRRYHHIMDPSTAAPRLTRYHSVTVQTPRAIDADAGSTAVFGLDSAAGTRILGTRAPGGRIVSA